MPDMSGLQLHAKFAEMQQDIRVIFLTGYSEFEYARQALNQKAFAYVLKGEGDEQVIDKIRQAMHVSAEPAFEPDKPVTGLQGNENQTWLLTLQTYIAENLDKDLSLQSLAEFCHFYPVYLSRVFKETVGLNISDYIGRIKLERAQELLRRSDDSVQEIAQKLGFATDNYFCRWFRKNTQSTPQSWCSAQTKKKE